MPITNKPQYGEPIVGHEMSSEYDLPARDPFQQYLDELTVLAEQNETGVAGNLSRIRSLELFTTNVLTAADFTDQNPEGLDTPLRITLGEAQENDFVKLDADGLVTIKQTGVYTFRLRLMTGRESNPGIVRLFTRAVAGGQQTGSSVETIIDNARALFSNTFSGDMLVPEGFDIYFELIRDSSANNEGGLRTGAPTVVDWEPSPSAQLLLDVFSVNVPEPPTSEVRFT